MMKNDIFGLWWNLRLVIIECYNNILKDFGFFLEGFFFLKII
jgi:hypothetical protein